MSHESILRPFAAALAVLLANAGLIAGGSELKLVDEQQLHLPFCPTPSVTAGNGNLTLVKDSCVIAWNFDNPSAPLADAFGHGSEMAVNGTGLSVVNDATRGNVLSFDGTAYLEGPGTDASLDGLPAGGVNLPFTVAFWIKPDSDCPKEAGLVYWGQAIARKQMLIRFNDGAKKLLFSVYGNGEAIYPAAATVFNGSWHHIAISYDGNRNFTVYYDGAQDLSLTIGANYVPPNRSLYIGNASKNMHYKGLMDDFVLVDYAMTPEGVAALAGVHVPSAAVVPDVAVNGTGSLFMTNGSEFSFGALSGSGVLGGVDAPGATIIVGDGVSAATSCVYSAMIRGGESNPASFVKHGASYEQILSGSAENVTNITVDAGVLTLRRPVARQGLVCMYQFDDPSDVGFDAGPVGFRLSELGGGESLSLVSDGVSGSALHFPETNYLKSAAAVISSRFPVRDDSFTFSTWIRPTTEACTDRAPIFCWGADRSRRVDYMRFHARTTLRFTNNDNSDVMDATTPSAMDDGDWHHVAVSYDSALHRKTVYFDGNVASRKDDVAALDVYRGDNFHIGHGIFTDVVYTGDMDEFMVLDYAWSDEDAAKEYARKPAATVAVESLLPQPVAHYTFDDAENLGADTSGNGLDMRTVGDVEAADDDLACGGAVRLSGSQYFTLDAAYDSDLLPKTNHSFTVICRYKADTDQSANTSVVSFGGSATSANITSGNIVKLGPGKNKTLAARYVAGATYEVLTGTARSGSGTGRQRWTTAAIVYTDRTDKRDNVVKCFLDGVEVKDDRNKAMNIVDERFDIGSDLAKEGGRSGYFSGLIDDVQVYNCALSAGEIDLITRRLAAGAGKTTATTPSVLGAGVSVSVADNALFGVRSVESVDSLSGAGDVEISSLSSLLVAKVGGFTGSIGGSGVLCLADNALVAFGDGAVPAVRSTGTVALGENVVVSSSQMEGVRVLMCAESFDGVENLATWTAENGRDVVFRLSSDGKSVTMKYRTGLALIFR